MAGTLIAILMLTVLGLPLALLLDRSSRGPLLLGVAFLQGSGAIFLLLLSLSLGLTLTPGTLNGLQGRQASDLQQAQQLQQELGN